jgi:hypothetical protein
MVAPGPGRSLVRRFADDGTLATVEVTSELSPGVAEPLGVAGTAAAAAEAAERTPGASLPRPSEAASGSWLAWAVLLTIATGSLLGAAAMRIVAVLREQRDAPDEQPPL